MIRALALATCLALTICLPHALAAPPASAAKPPARAAPARAKSLSPAEARAEMEALAEAALKERDTCRKYQEEIKKLAADRASSARFVEKDQALSALRLFARYPGTSKPAVLAYELLLNRLPSDPDHDWIARAYARIPGACGPLELAALGKRLAQSIPVLELTEEERHEFAQSWVRVIDHESNHAGPLIPLAAMTTIFRELLSSKLMGNDPNLGRWAGELAEAIENTRMELVTRIQGGAGSTNAGFADNVLHELRESERLRVRLRQLLRRLVTPEGGATRAEGK